VPAAIEVAAYRIAQEALTNVVRHSGAGRCRLGVTAEPSWLELVVSDDGQGVDGTGPRGLGLASMDERAREIGGCLSLDTSADGTIVSVRLPLTPEVPR
jgi:two-component system NarL family sensor kinase